MSCSHLSCSPLNRTRWSGVSTFTICTSINERVLFAFARAVSGPEEVITDPDVGVGILEQHRGVAGRKAFGRTPRTRNLSRLRHPRAAGQVRRRGGLNSRQPTPASR